MPTCPPLNRGGQGNENLATDDVFSGSFSPLLVGEGLGERSNEIAIVVGDVTGHGMQGAMNAVMADGILHSVAKERETLDPTQLMSALNDALNGRLEDQMNVTMVIGLINTETKTLTLANAAHHAHPLLVRDGDVTPLVAKSMPLGMMEGLSYREVEWTLQSGDVLVFMTDGIIEASDADGSIYLTSGRLETVISQIQPNQPAEAMVDAVINDAAEFSDGRAYELDDMTVVVVKVL